MSFFIQSLMTFDDTSRSLLPLDPLRPRAELHRLRDGLQRLHRPLQRRRVSQQTEQSHKSQKWGSKECLSQLYCVGFISYYTHNDSIMVLEYVL